MLFNTYGFIFIFLPITLIIFLKIGRLSHHRVAMSWLILSSLFFYGWWNPIYLGLILGSIIFNYALGVILSNSYLINRKLILTFGIVVNIGLIGYYKYTNFVIDNINILLNSNFYVEQIVLPLAISFFTFQQIAYLVDAYRGETREYNFLHYCLFVLFFPQLIAGPIVHHKEMLPQFADDKSYRLNYENISIGITVFIVGLFKKVVLADNVALYATPIFLDAESNHPLTFFSAWGGALAYTFQLYFDFSGYSDMAIGIARMFGIHLPINFNSPYKATSIIDFWRRWHITLSRFLKEYIYFPLGGNRKGTFRRYLNLLITMLIGGLWHGAGWTFIVWGGLHGSFLIINHAWQALYRYSNINLTDDLLIARYIYRGLTFVAVVVSWVFFRAKDLTTAMCILQSMMDISLLTLKQCYWYLLTYPQNIFAHGLDQVTYLILLSIIVWYFPNTQEFMFHYNLELTKESKNSEYPVTKYITWEPKLRWALICGALGFMSIISLTRVSEFLYFQF